MNKSSGTLNPLLHHTLCFLSDLSLATGFWFSFLSVMGSRGFSLSKREALSSRIHVLKVSSRDFPGGSVVKDPPANAGDTSSIPDLGRFHVPQNYLAHAP